MLEYIFDPPPIKELTDYYKTIITVAGILFGFTSSMYIFIMGREVRVGNNNDISAFESVILYIENLLAAYGYLILMPILEIYFGQYRIFISIMFYLFAVILIGINFELIQYGTLSSKIFFYFWHGVIFLYPIIVSRYEQASFILNTKAITYSTLILLFFSVPRTIIFLRLYHETFHTKLASSNNLNDTKTGETRT